MNSTIYLFICFWLWKSRETCVASFSASRVWQQRERLDHNKEAENAYEKVEGESNFWNSRFKRIDKDPKRIPWYSSLDNDGQLPETCYRKLGSSLELTKPTCLVTVAVDLLGRRESLEDAETLVSQVHRLMDSGLTTFQLKGHPKFGESRIYKQVCAETPSSVLENCNLVVPMKLPQKLTSNPSDDLRRRVLNVLSRTGQEALDTVQVDYEVESPYHLDALDVLNELQRDGYVRSIAARNFTPSLLREVVDCDFDAALSWNQVSMNILNPTLNYSPEQLFASQETKIPLVLDSVLAGGLLTDRYIEQPSLPYPWKMTPTERIYVQSALYQWAKHFIEGDDDEDSGRHWEEFQGRLMPVLSHLALKYRVSVASVALRWALQLEKVTSVVAACGWNPPEKEYTRPKQLRSVFSFELDSEDMELLWEATGTKPPSTTDLLVMKDLENYEQHDDGSGLFLPPPSMQRDQGRTNYWI